ncbi:hypothetical protein FD755_020886 [Muntiacus reevesi]|uniref:Spt4/RpoE2 zinc finger domain-containing protein n=1 Tax=Muntiacus reevesi TaxID=9886 RepID=A0A5N3X0A3_MUNRE|nr:hypothetical protein FD755_020886 [Muntiacus reevesi]
MALETVPKDLRHLRACLLCSLVKTIDQFEYDGCDNCDAYLQMKGNREMVYDCTSSSFDGSFLRLLAHLLISPSSSPWQPPFNFPASLITLGTSYKPQPSVVVLVVISHLPQKLSHSPGHQSLRGAGIVRELKSRGVAYKSRDTAIKT